mmetsp:Transcript_38751/g.102442  ORF Transcript_38751/g.102442 Transcript_38751/m.102442 type:complete len:351 (-) Transcript_38751:53-1105(-)
MAGAMKGSPIWLLGLNEIAVHMLRDDEHQARGDVRHVMHAARKITFFQSAALLCALFGGVGHGVAMAVRKRFGEGHEGSMQYWFDWRWWVGTWMDGAAGMLIWPAMPLISVHLLMPMVAVAQLVASYLLGLFVFGERATLQSLVGTSCALVGVLGLGLSTPSAAEDFRIDDFFVAWVRPRFVAATFVCLGVLAGAFAFTRPVTKFALSAGFFEGVQFLCSRAMVDAAFDNFWAIFTNPAVFACVFLKGCCILSILSLQQKGLESDMSRFAGIYLVASTLFICTYGAIFFGDTVPLTAPFVIASLSTLCGIWCLNEAVHPGFEADGASEPLLKDDLEAKQPDALAASVAGS